MRAPGARVCGGALLARRREQPEPGPRERRRRRALREAVADNRRLEFLAALSLSRVALPTEDTRVVARLLRTARAHRYHLILNLADRRRCDELAREHGGKLE